MLPQAVGSPPPPRPAAREKGHTECIRFLSSRTDSREGGQGAGNIPRRPFFQKRGVFSRDVLAGGSDSGV